MTLNSHSTIAVVIPVYNEESILPAFHERLKNVLNGLANPVRIYYVDDGSTDRSGQILEQIAAHGKTVTILELSRNFGHQAALTAGLDAAEGDFILTLDGDGQHPPELIPQIIELASAGYDIVQTQRVETQAGASLKRVSSNGFYRLINLLSGTKILPGTADFRLLSRQVVDELRRMPEYHRFLRGMVSWVGYRSVILPYQPAERMGGRSKYSLGKMMRLAMDAVFSFSLIPLYIGLSMGVFFLILAVIEVIYVSRFWVLGLQSQLAPGWSSLMFMLLCVGGFLMILLGFIGMYVGYIFQEVKRRPVYLVRRTVTADETDRPQ